MNTATRRQARSLEARIGWPDSLPSDNGRLFGWSWRYLQAVLWPVIRWKAVNDMATRFHCDVSGGLVEIRCKVYSFNFKFGTYTYKVSEMHFSEYSVFNEKNGSCICQSAISILISIYFNLFFRFFFCIWIWIIE